MSQRFVTSTYQRWLSDPEVTKHLASRDQSIEQLREYVDARERADDVRFWAVVAKDSGRHIGNVKLEPINWESGSAVFGLMIGDKEYWGRGIATEVTKVVVGHAFDSLQLKRIELGVEEDNTAAIRTYEKVGFSSAPHPKQLANTKWMVLQRT